jgi:hypothetical protein
MSQQLLKQEMSVSQILRMYGKQFKQIREQYSDGLNGRCAIGVIMSYYGWNGKDGTGAARSFLTTLVVLREMGINSGLLIEMNDFGVTFNEIDDYLDQYHESAHSAT